MSDATSKPRRSRDYVKMQQTLAALDMPQLRELRNHIRADMERVSYWSRLMESRIEQIENGKSLDPVPVRVIAATAEPTLSFAAILEYTGSLPQAHGKWALRHDNANQAEIAAHSRAVGRSVSQLHRYRTFLKTRLDFVTDELISRYRTNPELIETLLPERRGRQETLDA